MRILVVDGEGEVQRIREHLEPRGFEVRGTHSGEDALHLWESKGPWNLVLTELWITPGKNIRSGLELAKAIRSGSASQRIAVHTSENGLLAAPVPVPSQAMQDRATASDATAARPTVGLRPLPGFST